MNYTNDIIGDGSIQTAINYIFPGSVWKSREGTFADLYSCTDGDILLSDGRTITAGIRSLKWCGFDTFTFRNTRGKYNAEWEKLCMSMMHGPDHSCQVSVVIYYEERNGGKSLIMVASAKYASLWRWAQAIDYLGYDHKCKHKCTKNVFISTNPSDKRNFTALCISGLEAHTPDDMDLRVWRNNAKI